MCDIWMILFFFCLAKKTVLNINPQFLLFLKDALHLELNAKSRYFPNKMGVNFCGYRIFATHKLLRNCSKKKIKRHVKKWNYLYKNNELDIPTL